ncbi:Mediator of RNA polymerase II transcription subunit 5 [Candida viswanathii]|uniref:Mediator of RNA polymerase II transcription subunit 5 n=1 Tax=Candida viswanathii TaxID=5486 RepID=A0A367Y1D9_9ASCO|nr:Mediator of RNA polymerase II transcription subunit 5 [Candida viswanathii]
MADETLSLSKLLEKAVIQKLQPKLFISLFNQFGKRKPIQPNEFVSELLNIKPDNNSLKQRKWNEYQVNVVIELSFSSVENNHLFWTSLNLADESSQCTYLLKLSRTLTSPQHYEKDVLKNFISVEFMDYVLKYIREEKLSDRVVEHIVFLFAVIVQKFDKFIEEKTSGAVLDFIVNFIRILRSLTGNDNLSSVLLLKSKKILSKAQIEQLESTRHAKMERQGSIISLNPNVQANVASLTMINKLDEFYFRVRYIWVHKTFRHFNFNDTFNFFVNNLVATSNQKNSYLIAYDFIKALLSGLDMDGYALFNVKNFLLTRAPHLLGNLRYGEDNLEKAVNDALQNVEIDNDFKQRFVKAFDFPDEPTLQFRDKFNDKLLNINSEFTSLEESGLVELVNALPKLCQLSKTHQEVTQVILDIVDELGYSRDFEKLNRLLLTVMNNVELVNIVLFNSNLSLLYKLLDLIDSSNFRIDDDDENFQDHYSYCGIIMLSILTIVQNFQIDLSEITVKDSFIINYLNEFYYRSCDNLTNATPVNSDEEDKIIVENYQNLLNEWITALFDDKNEGLSDDLIKSLSIKQIYKLVPLIYKQGIVAADLNKIDWCILSNGLEYLSQPFLTPIVPIIIKSLVRDCNIDFGLKLRVIKEMINDTSNPITKLVISICGNDVMKLNPPAELKEHVQQNVHYVDRTEPFPRDYNVKDAFRSQLLGETSLLSKFITTYVLGNRGDVVNSLIQEIYNFQKSNHEDSKMFINLMVFIVLLDSIETRQDRDYWKRELPSSCKTTVQKSSEPFFEASMDHHYSSIFNDPSSNSSFGQQQDGLDGINDFLKGVGGDDDDQMMQDDDLFNEKPKTSDQLQNLLQKAHHHRCLVNQFRKKRGDLLNNALFGKSVSLLNDKLVEEMTNWRF